MFRCIGFCSLFYAALFASSISVEEILLERKESGCNFTIQEYLLHRPGITELQFLAPDISMNDAERCFLLSEVQDIPSIQTIRVGTLTQPIVYALEQLPHITDVTCEGIDPEVYGKIPSHVKLTVLTPFSGENFPRANLDRFKSVKVRGDALSLINLGMLRNGDALESIEIIGEAPLRFFEVLQSIPSLRNVSLVETALTDEIVEWMVQRPDIEWSFSDCRLLRPKMLKKISRIRSLTIRPEEYSVELLRTLYALPSIEQLSIAFPKYFNSDPFSFLSLLSNLKSLSLRNVPKHIFPSMKKLGKLQKLETLVINAHASTDTFQWITELPALKTAVFVNCSFLGGIPFLSNNLTLRTVQFFSCRIDDAACKDIATCKNLRTLYLDGNEYSNKGVAYLAELSHLEHLCIANTYITSQGVQHIGQLQGLKEITLIGVQCTFQDLVKVFSNSKIRWFSSSWYTDLWQDVLGYFFTDNRQEMKENEIISAYCRGDSLLDGCSMDIEGFPIRKLFAVKKYLSKEDLQAVTDRFTHLFSDSKPPSKVRLSMYYYTLLEKAMQYEQCRALFVPPENPFVDS